MVIFVLIDVDVYTSGSICYVIDNQWLKSYTSLSLSRVTSDE